MSSGLLHSHDGLSCLLLPLAIWAGRRSWFSCGALCLAAVACLDHEHRTYRPYLMQGL
jgi:hypothetical protein